MEFHKVTFKHMIVVKIDRDLSFGSSTDATKTSNVNLTAIFAVK